MAEAFIGKWSLTTANNFENYAKAAGVKQDGPKPEGPIKLSTDVSIIGDTWKINIELPHKTFPIEFKLGQECDDITPDGRKVRSIFTLDGNTLTQIQKGEVESTFIRQIQGNKMLVTAKAKDVVATAELVKA